MLKSKTRLYFQDSSDLIDLNLTWEKYSVNVLSMPRPVETAAGKMRRDDTKSKRAAPAGAALGVAENSPCRY